MASGSDLADAQPASEQDTAPAAPATPPVAENKTEPTEPAPVAPAVVTESRPIEPTPPAVRSTVAEENDVPEETLRREAVESTRLASSLSAPFNLRRIQAGVPSAIKTIRIADAGGLDVAMMQDLAAAFLTEIETSASASLDAATSGTNGQAGTQVASTDISAIDIRAIDIKTTDSQSAFARMFDNEVDIVVTREPISVTEAERLSRAFGVNMRSRYAEYIVACLLYTSPSPRDQRGSRMPSSA